eukprot:2894234-Heterocapsa_arctica.AAC.1
MVIICHVCCCFVWGGAQGARSSPCGPGDWGPDEVQHEAGPGVQQWRARNELVLAAGGGRRASTRYQNLYRCRAGARGARESTFMYPASSSRRASHCPGIVAE